MLCRQRPRIVESLICFQEILQKMLTNSQSRMAVRYGSILARKYGTPFFVMVRYVFFVIVYIRYVDTLFEIKIPDFSHIAPAFCTQRQKTPEADAV